MIAYQVLSFMWAYVTSIPIRIKWISPGDMWGNLGPVYGNAGIAALRSHVGNCLFCMSVRTALLETLVNIRIPEATPTVCGVGEL